MQLVEDEWERQLESDEDLDLLFVTYDPTRVTVEKMRETISAYEFKVEVRDGLAK